MSYKLNAAAWNGVFAVPNCVADEHLKKAGGQQLKVLLFLLRHNAESLSADDVSAGTGMSASDVKDAIQYWKETGLVFEEGETPPEMKTGESDASVHRELPDIAPTYEQVAARTLEDENLRALFNEIQIKLGRTIGYSDQSHILMMYDYYGLPLEVILTIVEYCCSRGKKNISYMTRVAKDWADKEINTLERVNAYLREIEADERLWKRFTSMFSVDPPNYTDKRFELLKHWHHDYKQSLQLIYYAYEITIENINKPYFGYTDRILEAWHAEKIRTPQEAMAARSKTPPGKETRDTSYDSEKVKEKARGPIEYRRKETKPDGK